MANLDDENKVLIEELKAKEAGVAELLEFYAGVETIYAASVRVLEDANITVVAKNANL